MLLVSVPLLELFNIDDLLSSADDSHDELEPKIDINILGMPTDNKTPITSQIIR